LSEIEAPFSARRFLIFSLSLRSFRDCWVSGYSQNINTVCRVGMRTGFSTREFKELYKTRSLTEICPQLFEEITSKAASTGARRMLIRLSQNSPIFSQARRAGYKPITAEHLYKLRETSISPTASQNPSLEDLGLRPRTDSDTHGLYRLYSVSTPSQIRSHLGMTIAEWVDALDNLNGQSHDYVFEHDRKIYGWLRSGYANKSYWFSLITMDIDREKVQSIIKWAACSANLNFAPTGCLVPAYDLTVSSCLKEAGFIHEKTFELMSHRITNPIGEKMSAVATIG